MNSLSGKPGSSQQGFTLLELMVVVSVLAAMAGIAAVAMDGYEREAQEQLVHTEMKRIANAIHRFKADTGYYPKTGIFADNTDNDANLEWLFSQPVASGGVPSMDWNATTGRGWHGPYLALESQQLLSTQDCDLDTLGTSSAFAALSDTFERNRTYTSSDSCFIVRDDGSWVARESSGRPYRYQINYSSSWNTQCTTGTDTCVALVSDGEDGVASNDDIVTVLRVNP